MCDIEKKAMRLSVIILTSILLTSCFPIDRSPIVHVTIEKSLIPEIDSIFLIETSHSYQTRETNSQKVKADINEYSFLLSGFNSVIRIKLKLKDTIEVISDSLMINDSKDKIKIAGQANKIKFEKIIKTKFQSYTPFIFIILLVILIAKIPLSVLIIWPSQKVRFIKLYSGLNCLYLLIFIIPMIIFSDIMIFLLYPFYLCVLLIDLIFLVKEFHEKGVLRPIIAGILGNLVFLTLGQLIITFAMMKFL